MNGTYEIYHLTVFKLFEKVDSGMLVLFLIFGYIPTHISFCNVRKVNKSTVL